MFRPALLLTALLCGCAAADGNSSRTDPAPTRHAQLAAVRTWGVQLTGYGDAGLRGVRDSSFDLVVVDPSRWGDGGDWTPAEVREAAHGRLLIAYLSLGAAENFRAYWQPGWRIGQPAWLLRADPDWPGNYDVAYWDPAWQALALRELDRVIDQGFHGAYLDLIDAYELHPARPGAPAEMVEWVCRAAAHAHARDPEFLIIPQNAADLIRDPRYAACVDATGQEETFVYATDHPTDAERQAGQLALYRLWRAAGKPVLTLDYATDPALVRTTYERARTSGLVPYVTGVGLDRLTPGR
ncbi:MJ1477/TM1410 family putative glycoside hydrolase [Deinococcus apachensis]|uniref:MJ1477/TM1410 family putative glycoside hydrolase n=1 Tax=Deinococcus apachensis TaxID=309886 RepID=UPI000368A5F8|nr:MJ1477/TM1410 family putative glycoside hydrolase [Deinococcus apachensis]